MSAPGAGAPAAPGAGPPGRPATAPRYLLRTHHLGKSFSGVTVLDDVTVDFEYGEVHALLGENGAGKSTLIKLVSGAYQPTRGSFTFDGRELSHLTPRQAIELGIAVVHQELNLVPEMSVSENIFLGREPTRSAGRVDWKAMHARAAELLTPFELQLDPRRAVARLSLAERQMVEIVKALLLDAKLIILDEPTDVLTDKETERLFRLIRRLKAAGKTIIYISHRLDELRGICDAFTVLRDGKHVHTGRLEGHTKDDIVLMMVARKLSQQYPRIEVAPGREVLRVEGLSGDRAFADVSFTLRAGEILGFYGLVGAGRTELMRAVLGADRRTGGRIFVEGVEQRFAGPDQALAAGVVYITESRKELGLLMQMPVQFNLTLSSLNRYLTRLRRIDGRREAASAQAMVESLAIRTASLTQEVRKLSGGNQQKALLARSMLVEPKILIFDEPTRGVDVGAKVGIYEILNRLKAAGVGIVVVSSDMPELLGVSDRLAVMHQGRLAGFFERGEMDEAEIAHRAFGSRSAEARA